MKKTKKILGSMELMTRIFKFNETILPDPNIILTPHEVLRFYRTVYPSMFLIKDIHRTDIDVVKKTITYELV